MSVDCCGLLFLEQMFLSLFIRTLVYTDLQRTNTPRKLLLLLSIAVERGNVASIFCTFGLNFELYFVSIKNVIRYFYKIKSVLVTNLSDEVRYPLFRNDTPELFQHLR